MPDRSRPARFAAALSGGVLAVALLGPVALAQTDEVPRSGELDPRQQPPPDPPEEPTPDPGQPEPGSWEASSFEEPFDEADATLRRDTFDIVGTLRYQKTGPSDFIEEIEVRIVDHPDDSFTPGDGCTVPSATTIAGEGPGPSLTAEQAFTVAEVSVPCNGRYLVEAEGRLEDPEAEPYTLRQAFVLAAPPASVTGLGVTLDGEERVVTATFQPPPDDTLAPDAVGYVLERSGPEGDTFADVASIDVGDEPRFVDPLSDAPAGAYTYRVRAVRAGADGDVRSSLTDTESDTIDVAGDPTSTSTSARRRAGTGGSRSGGRVSVTRSGPAPRLTTPTTLDTGFEDILDYGDGNGATDGGDDDELAGDEPVAGSSIVRDEGEGMGLAVPAAGALVMLGWAGHLLYLNRLAKQL